jgi:hypothetical protein
MSADQLVLAEHLANLNRVAQKGNMDLQLLLAETQRLTEMLPTGEIGDATIEALVGIVRERPKAPN